MGAETWGQVLLESAIKGGPWAVAFLVALRAGFHKVWVWGWLLEKAEAVNAKLQEKIEALEQKADAMRLSIEKEIRDALKMQSELNQQIAQLHTENRTLREQLSARTRRQQQEP